jgi:hypothetical protein
MSTKNICQGLPPSPRVVRRFGQACLICVTAGRYRLEGGSEEDYTAAKEWASLFAHEIVFSQPTNGARMARVCMPRTLPSTRFKH